MSIMIREYLGFESFSKEPSVQLKHLKESASSAVIPSNALMVDIEGIHVGPTRNFTRYMEEALKSSIKSWTSPYNKPVIMHHNEKDGEIIGRVNHVEYKSTGTLSGTGALLFNVGIPDKNGAEQIKDGRLLTTSIGVIAHDIRCSCCGSPIYDMDGCEEHTRGGVYDGEVAYWDIYDMEAKEISYVVVPSDPYAKNVKIYDQKAPLKIAESLENIKGGTFKMDEAKVQELQESIDTLNAELEKQATELAEAKGKVETLTAEKETLSTELTEATAAKETAETALAEKQAELESEVALRESAESTVVELKEAAKAELIKSYASLRSLTGKAELSEAVIGTRSIDSLKDSIADLQVELSEGVKTPKTVVPAVITDPTITESKIEDVKKAESASNINLEEGLLNLFAGSANHFANK